MRVLWICNIMLPIIAEHLHLQASNKEGWLSGLVNMVLERQSENQVTLGVAFPVGKELSGYREDMITESGAHLKCYGFYEDVNCAETYEEGLEEQLQEILKDFGPDVIHCFGTEYAHTLATLRACGQKERMIVSIQGLCAVYAQAYMADLPAAVQNSVTFRDWLKKDSIRQQQEKFAKRGEHETEVLKGVFNVAGRTKWDAYYTGLWNPSVQYYSLNETLRPCFYEGIWPAKDYEPHTIFLSQGDYPIKGLHYMLRALPAIREKFPDAKIVVAGNSLVAYESLKDKLKLSAYGKYLRQLIAENDLESAVEFKGRLTAEEMKEQFLHCGMYVCCSTMENSPNSLGEAMLLGVPCVAADVGGIPSLFEHEKDGLLYRGFRSEEITFYDQEKETAGLKAEVAERLAGAVIRMFEDRKLRESCCEHAREHARATHNRENNYHQLLEIYQDISGKA